MNYFSISLKQSFFVHLLFTAFFLIFYLKNHSTLPEKQNIKFEVYEAEIPLEKLKIVENPVLKQKKIETKAANQTKPANEVFGLNRNALTSTSASASVAIKLGNTINKENDNKVLNKDDPDTIGSNIPTPAEEYLITEMPRVLSEFRVPYPLEAKQKNIQGPVVIDIIIDETGKVRWSKLVNGPGFGLNEAGLESIKKFKFSPAKIDKQNVAVKIRYSIKFVLEK